MWPLVRFLWSVRSHQGGLVVLSVFRKRQLLLMQYFGAGQ